MLEIVVCSMNELFIILCSVGVIVYVDNDLKNVEEYIVKYVLSDSKIIIYDVLSEVYV